MKGNKKNGTNLYADLANIHTASFSIMISKSDDI